MRSSVIIRKCHKWLALPLAVQMLLWSLGGFYMVAVDLDFIHGDSLVRNTTPTLPLAEAQVPFAAILLSEPDARQISLISLLERPHFLVTTSDGEVVYDAVSGEPIPPLPESLIAELGWHYYAGAGALDSVSLISDNPPLELGPRALPVWRVDFDDWLRTSLYIAPHSGELITRRHQFWRLFDFFWMLHIMDYDTRTEVNHPLLQWSSIVATLFGITGIWLVFVSLRRRLTRPEARP